MISSTRSSCFDVLDFRGFNLRFIDVACTSSSPGGHQVDGLPPAAHFLFGIVIALRVSPGGNQVDGVPPASSMYDLNSDKGARYPT